MNAATQIIIERYELTNLIIEAVKMGVDKYIQMPKKDTKANRQGSTIDVPMRNLR